MADDGQVGRARGAQRRALWWLLGGIGLLALGIVVTAPELLADLGGLGSLMLLVIAAGLPGLAIVLVVAARRRAFDPRHPNTDHRPRDDTREREG